jgi:hypothetical protein
VILDSDLAAIYGVSAGRLNEAAKGNIERFPEDFMLRLSDAEHDAIIAILSAIRQLMLLLKNARRSVLRSTNPPKSEISREAFAPWLY